MGTLILITPKGLKISILLGQVINLSISSSLLQTPSVVISSVDNNVVELLFNCFFDLIIKFLYFVTLSEFLSCACFSLLFIGVVVF